MTGKTAGLTFILLCVCMAVLPAQDIMTVGMLRARLAEDFEKKPSWTAVSAGKGIQTALMLRAGAPAVLSEYEADVLAQAPAAAALQRNVLGVKITITDAGAYAVIIKPDKPILLGTFVKNFSCWVHSNNLAVSLICLFNDKDNTPVLELDMGELIYSGWKRISVSIPYLPLGTALSFAGFKLILPPMDIRAGTICYYFDFIGFVQDEVYNE